ncbi:MAG: AAA family ATPase [Prevotella sp.]|nr:AAA family ATPase [Prevotella sp.]
MKIKTLYIKSFANIQEETFDFGNSEGLTLLIGNNGSGKSSLLECISDIFSNLYFEEEGRAFKFVSPFQIVWELDGVDYTAAWDGSNLSKLSGGNAVSPLTPFRLPQGVVAIYSGESQRLWEHFYEPSYKNFISSINRSAAGGLVVPAYPRMLFLNRYYWHLSLLSLLCSDSAAIKKFCTDELGIGMVNEIKFTLNTANYQDYTVTDVLTFVKKLEGNNTFASLDAFKQFLLQSGVDSAMLFEYLYLAFTSKNKKIISDITVKFNQGLEVDALSEGGKKRLLIKAALEYAGQENTLFLLDEPDAHVHIKNKRQIVDTVKEYTTNRHVMMTTHSPSVCRFVKNIPSIVMMDKGKRVAVADQIEAGHKLTDDTTLYNVLFSTKNIVVTEGKTDCLYIKKALEKLTGSFPLLRTETEFIPIGGTDPEVDKDFLAKIAQLEGRKIIRLVDRDEAGLKCARALIGNENLKKVDITDFRAVNGRTDMFLLMLPPATGTNYSEDFLIEDYFDHAKVLAISKQYIDQKFTGPFNEFPKVKKDLKESLLPEFAKTTVNAADMEGFTTLLEKLETKLAE